IESAGGAMVTSNHILRDQVERKLRLLHLHGPKDETTKTLNMIRPILAGFQEQNLELTDLLQEVVDAINKLFWLKEVTIGLRDPDDKYRYKVMCGLRPDAWTAHKEIAYTLEEFLDSEHYKCSQMSRYTRVFLAEDKPFRDGEVDTFTRPILLKAIRKSVDDCIEGDYFDTHIFDENGGLIGWIEISGTKGGKFPDPMALRWIELLALIIGIAITRDDRSGRNEQAKSRLKPLIPFARNR
ncbi:MAG: hypothetical protein WBD03_04695, partial [Thermoplasmata archaeon]